MNRLTLIAFFLLSVRAFAATGDITAIRVDSDGWSVFATIEGKVPGGTYDFGLGVNNDPATGVPKAVFTVTRISPGTGTPTTVVDSVYGTIEVRKPWPNDAQNDETIIGGSVEVKFALSETIYAGDTVTASISSGLYTQSGVSNAFSGVVTNNSAVTYAATPTIGAWNTVPFQRITGNFKLRASAFQVNGREYKPVRAVKFSVSDGTTTLTDTVTTITVSNDDGDAVPIPEYIGNFDVSSLIQGATLTCNFIAYPWVGDSSTILDTSTGTVAPSPRHGPITMILDKTGAYGVTEALVDPSTGSDSGANTVYDTTVYNQETAYKFATIAGAAKAIKDYNTANRGRADVGAGVINIVTTNHLWIGASLGSVYGSTPATWITIRGTNSASDSILTNTAGQTDISDRIKFENLTVTSPNSFTGIGATWWKNCIFNVANTSLFRPGVHWVTQSNIAQLTQGLKSFSTENTAFAMVRGCNLTGFAGQIHYYNVIGNLKTGVVPGNPRFIAAINGSTAPAPQCQILAYNRIYGFDAGVDGSNLMLTAGKTPAIYSHQRGLAIVQNIFERIGTSRLGTVLDINTSDGDDFDNVILWNNTMMGERQNCGYNAKGTLVKWRRYWSVKNNIFHDWNSKHDTFDGEDVASGNRIGSWSNLFGVAYSGNILGGENGDFENEFDGLRSQSPYFFDNDGNVDDVFKFVDYRANDGVNPGTGDGDYKPLATSPAYNLQYEKLIPYDIYGSLRGTTDSAGAITTYTVAGNTNPVVTITSPITGSSTTSPVNLVGTAIDTEDGTISSLITWSSTINGPLGTGASISTPLSVGIHTITASVTDGGSASDSDTITLTITSPSASGTINANRVEAQTVTIQ